jgi:hypothetical protein
MQYKQHVFTCLFSQVTYKAYFYFLPSSFKSDVTEHLQLLLRKAGYHFHTTAEKEVVRIIKERHCYVAINPTKEEKDAGGKCDEFALPDGNVVKVRILVGLLFTIATR